MEHSLHYLLMENHTTMQKKIRNNIKEMDLSLGQPKVLDYLLDHDGAIQKDIARGCFIEPASISSILNGMEKNGLVIRKPDKENRRNYNIYLTDKGKEIAQKLQVEIEAVEKSAVIGLENDEIEKLKNWLEKIYQNMEQ